MPQETQSKAAAQSVDNYAPNAGFRVFFAFRGKGCARASTFAGADVSLA